MTETQSKSDYELLREKKIARNEARLEELGLHDVKKKLAAAARKTTTKRLPKRRAQPVAPTRKSRRQSNKPVQFQPLMDDDEEIREARKKFKAVKKRTKAANMKFKCEVPANLSAALTAKQKKVMEKKIDCDWLEMFEDYLTNVDEISYENRRNVLKQITKLATGEGIRYESQKYGWPEGCFFLRGTKVGPTDDIPKLMKLGQKCEDEWGEDRGNGWLLRHPLMKMYQFQQYQLQE